MTNQKYIKKAFFSLSSGSKKGKIVFFPFQIEDTFFLFCKIIIVYYV